jgi:hypothetical protein
MKEFMYLFRGGDAARIDMQKDEAAWAEHMGKWKTWMESLAAKDQFSGGQPLSQEGKVLKGRAKKLSDGPYVEAKEIVGGYLLIKANDLDEATEIAKGCPLFEHDGIVEIREVNQLAM